MNGPRQQHLTSSELRALLAPQRRASGRRAHPERDIQRAIVDALSGPQWARRVFAFHVPNGGGRNQREAKELRRDGVRSGVADLAVMLPDARTLWLEVKAPNGSVKKAQKEFREVCNVLGHPYRVVRSVAEALAAVEEEIGATNHERRTA